MRNQFFSASPDAVRQEANRDWWECNPMTYDWEGAFSAQEGTVEWYAQADERFWSLSKPFAHPEYPESLPFSRLIDYQNLQGKAVLEIGCGLGAQAAVLANAGARVTAVDLTERAVSYTKRRFELFRIEDAAVIRSDAESLPFPDRTFDFVWSWGVIHHTANPQRAVSEIFRVLKINGRASVMIYHRNSTRYYLYGGLYQGLLRGHLLRHRSLYAVNMTFTDGYVARHYTREEATRLFGAFCSVTIQVMDGAIPTMIPGWGRLSRLFPTLMQPINRWIAKRWGWFLFVDAVK